MLEHKVIEGEPRFSTSFNVLFGRGWPRSSWGGPPDLPIDLNLVTQSSKFIFCVSSPSAGLVSTSARDELVLTSPLVNVP